MCSVEMDGMRKQMQEMKTTIHEEQTRADRVEIENKRLLDKLKTLQQEREVSPSDLWTVQYSNGWSVCCTADPEAELPVRSEQYV